MFENVKLFVCVYQDYYDYEGYSSAEVTRILIGPQDANTVQLQEEWRNKTWQARSYTRKGVTKLGKQKYQTIGFLDWLLKEKGFSVMERSQWDVIGTE